MSKLLVVDDEESICWGLSRLGKELGHEATTASSAEEALRLADEQKYDVVVLDVRLPGMDGLSAISRLRESQGTVPIVVMTAYGDLDTAVQAVQNGAFEYLVKPFDKEKVREVLVRAVDAGSRPGEDFHAVTAVEGFVGTTAAMQDVFNRIALAAASGASVLLRGESGTGKELAARAIHRYSSRRDRPFVAVNVASLSPALAESELFGHVRGAFTGADQPRVGLLVKANQGTLFLDEVADIPLPTQVKLLRALEDGEVLPVGADEAVRTDLRLISATHQDLQRLTRESLFRHDLYFRISTFQIELPPLRERRDDIAALATFFAKQLAPSDSSGSKPFSDEATEELQRRDWHGNVRELRNAVEHALIVARGSQIMAEHFPDPMAAPISTVNGQRLEAEIETLLTEWSKAVQTDEDAAGQVYERLLALVEPPVLQAIVASQGGQIATSARMLGVHRTTLRKKIDQYGLEES